MSNGVNLIIMKEIRPKQTRRKRRWGLAFRLEHRRVKGKNRKRPGKEK